MEKHSSEVRERINIHIGNINFEQMYVCVCVCLRHTGMVFRKGDEREHMVCVQ